MAGVSSIAASPRALAGIEISCRDLAQMAEGGFCLDCHTSTFPQCPFGK
ncbi:MAG: hypothetical protein P4L39_08135 [Humidesulfovibrio sp.]|nr:hypothetical protein [Humidesulfovibrio sp.]